MVVVETDLRDMDSELGHVLSKVVTSVTPVLASISLGYIGHHHGQDELAGLVSA